MDNNKFNNEAPNDTSANNEINKAKQSLHEARVAAGRKAAATRGHASLSAAGKKGAQALSHDVRVAAGKKAAVTRGYKSLSEAGRKGGLNSRRNKVTPQNETETQTQNAKIPVEETE